MTTPGTGPMTRAATRGVLYVHSAPSALCPHIEWAVGGVLGHAPQVEWSPQPAQPGSYRAEYSWAGDAGTAAALTSALRGWNHLRFEVTEESDLEHRGRPLLRDPRPRRLPRRHRAARRHHDPRGPASRPPS